MVIQMMFLNRGYKGSWWLILMVNSDGYAGLCLIILVDTVMVNGDPSNWPRLLWVMPWCWLLLSVANTQSWLFTPLVMLMIHGGPAGIPAFNEYEPDISCLFTDKVKWNINGMKSFNHKFLGICSRTHPIALIVLTNHKDDSINSPWGCDSKLWLVIRVETS